MLELDIHKKLQGSRGEMALDVQLRIKEYDFIALSGQSGSGKTTLLRILAGLEEASGSICLGDEVWLDGKSNLPTQKRGIGFVLQDYALFAT